MLERLAVGARVYFADEKRPYQVRARSERFAICTKPAFGSVIYTILDTKEMWRGPDDRLFCQGYETDEQCAAALQKLEAGEIRVSIRRCVPLTFGSGNGIVRIDGLEGE